MSDPANANEREVGRIVGPSGDVITVTRRPGGPALRITQPGIATFTLQFSPKVSDRLADLMRQACLG